MFDGGGRSAIKTKDPLSALYQAGIKKGVGMSEKCRLGMSDSPFEQGSLYRTM